MLHFVPSPPPDLLPLPPINPVVKVTGSSTLNISWNHPPLAPSKPDKYVITITPIKTWVSTQTTCSPYTAASAVFAKVLIEFIKFEIKIAMTEKTSA